MQAQPERHVLAHLSVQSLAAATRTAAATVAAAGGRPWAVFRAGGALGTPTLQALRKFAADSRSRVRSAGRAPGSSADRRVLEAPNAVHAIAASGAEGVVQLRRAALRSPRLPRRVHGRHEAGTRVPVRGAAHGATPGRVAQPGGSDPSAVRVVTIAYQAGTNGEAVGRAVAEQLGFRYVDGEVLQVAAGAGGLSLETLRAATEHHGFLHRFVESFAYSTADPIETCAWPSTLRVVPLPTTATCRSLVEGVIRSFATQGAVVLAGHGAEFVLAGHADVLRVLVTGGLAARATRACAPGMTQAQATQSLVKSDRERVAYYRRFYGAGWLDPATYDLTVSTDRLAVDDAATAIVTVLARRPIFRGDLSG